MTTAHDNASRTRPLSADCVLRWENRTSGRYYLAMARRNLWGEWEVWRLWGGLGSQRGGERSDPAAHEQAALDALACVAKRRAQRGYQLRTS